MSVFNHAHNKGVMPNLLQLSQSHNWCVNHFMKYEICIIILWLFGENDLSLKWNIMHNVSNQFIGGPKLKESMIMKRINVTLDLRCDI